MEKLGYVDGKYHYHHIDDVSILKKSDLNKAADLILKCLDAIEKEAAVKSWAPAPHFYIELSIVYGKLKRHDEALQAIERYMKCVSRLKGLIVEIGRVPDHKIIKRIPLLEKKAGRKIQKGNM